MKQFMDENFLLESKTAQELYHNHAANMPIIDYHCHLIPEMVASDHRFKSITELWLGGDHYKWRAMRTNGVEERFCTGKDTTDWEKFEKWAETVPYTFRNPLYHWTHLELKTAFGITKLLSPATAREIFDECNEKLQQPGYTARGLMRRYHVECVCTTDDPIDDLRYHKQTREDGFEIKMLPAWRPDKAMNIDKPEFAGYVNQLAEVAGVSITKFSDMVDALQKRHDFFHENGCRLSDHGIEKFYDEDYTESQIEIIFEKAMRGQQLSNLEVRQYKHCFLTLMAEMDSDADSSQYRTDNSKVHGIFSGRDDNAEDTYGGSNKPRNGSELGRERIKNRGLLREESRQHEYQRGCKKVPGNFSKLLSYTCGTH